MLSVGDWVVSEACVHVAVSPLAAYEASASEHAFSNEPRSLQRPLLGSVVDLGDCLQAMDGRRGEQVVRQQALRGRAVTLAAVLWQQQDANLEASLRPGRGDGSPVHDFSEGAVSECDDQERVIWA